MASENTPDRNHTKTSQPATNYGQPGWGDGVTSSATTAGAEKLTIQAASAENRIGFSGASQRRVRRGFLGKVLDVLFGKDPDIFDAYGRVRHNFPEKKWKDWDARIRGNKAYDWRLHSGSDASRKAKK